MPEPLVIGDEVFDVERYSEAGRDGIEDRGVQGQLDLAPAAVEPGKVLLQTLADGGILRGEDQRVVRERAEVHLLAQAVAPAWTVDEDDLRAEEGAARKTQSAARLVADAHVRLPVEDGLLDVVAEGERTLRSTRPSSPWSKAANALMTIGTTAARKETTVNWARRPIVSIRRL